MSEPMKWDPKYWIAVDLDGTLAACDHPQGHKPPYPIGTPIVPMVERIKRWDAEGKTVRIFTARVALQFIHPEGSNVSLQCAMILGWLQKLGLRHLMVTAQKDPDCLEIWDDRAVQVVKSVGKIAERQQSFFATELPENYRQSEIFIKVVAQRLEMEAKGEGIKGREFVPFNWLMGINEELFKGSEGGAGASTFQPAAFRKKMVLVAAKAFAAIEHLESVMKLEGH